MLGLRLVMRERGQGSQSEGGEDLAAQMEVGSVQDGLAPG